ncbi:NAD(P)-dependent oxidoreductase [Isachenkonia alkalipeptolytica]|uniref:Dihydrofolate reductase n=1 Tax=Isachenkonia alkalipeptolytica TaxID=2565777 RepID=A0AA44BEF9_9CLOT|nr:NAD(P)-dependent oxidoreductase [Isachenkonia alkalipeptolytica]NBG87491.1 dihydrofolate reductase [Isachenkonia alkalipeptolytica]
MKLKKIVSVDNTRLVPEVRAELESLAEETIFYEDYPETKEAVEQRMKDAEVVLVSWNTKIHREAILGAKNLKYIGMCCSLYDEESANVDIAAARELSIPVLGVKDYGDEGVIEFIISELVSLLHGFHNHQWRDFPTELTGQKLGIIGMGTLGKMLTATAKHFNMEVYYYSRSRKPEVEALGATYLPKEELLQTVDILSTHLPRNTVALSPEDFETFGAGKILINTSLGKTYDLQGFRKWIENRDNYAIFDVGGLEGLLEEMKAYENVITSNNVAGFTTQAKARLSEKVLENLREVFPSLPEDS